MKLKDNMKKVIVTLVLLSCGVAQAQQETGWKVEGSNAIGRATNVLRVEGKEGVEITADVAGEASGLVVRKSGDVGVPVTSMTPAAAYTPISGSTLKAGINLLPSASPTLAIVFVEPHKMRGATKVVISDSANPALIHPLPNAQSTPTSINALGVATPFSIAAGTVNECIGVSDTNVRCRAR